MGKAKHARPQVGANRPGAKRKASALTKSSGALAALDPHRPDELISMNITTASLKAARDKFVEEQKKMGTDVKEKQPKRLVAISYRGVEYNCPVHSHYDEYMCREAALVEGLGVQLGLMPELWCERQLVKDGAEAAITIEPEILASAKAAREGALASTTSSQPSGEVILDIVQGHQSQFMLLHRYWRVTVFFWSSLAGEGSEHRLHHEILGCLGTKEKPITIEDVVANLGTFSKSKLMR